MESLFLSKHVKQCFPMTWPGLALADSPLTTPHHTENIPENLSTHIYIYIYMCAGRQPLDHPAPHRKHTGKHQHPYIYICVLADNPLTPSLTPDVDS